MHENSLLPSSTTGRSIHVRDYINCGIQAWLIPSNAEHKGGSAKPAGRILADMMGLGVTVKIPVSFSTSTLTDMRICFQGLPLLATLLMERVFETRLHCMYFLSGTLQQWIHKITKHRNPLPSRVSTFLKMPR
jgi:hypothetical protein